MAITYAKIMKRPPAVIFGWPHFHYLWLGDDLPLHVVETVRLNSNIDFQVIFANLVLDLRLPQEKVFFHVLECFQPQVHVNGGNTFAPVPFGVEYQVLLDFQFMNGLPSILPGLVLDKLPVDVELEAAELRVNSPGLTFQMSDDCRCIFEVGSLRFAENFFILLLLKLPSNLSLAKGGVCVLICHLSS